MANIREVLEVAEALRALGLTVFVEVNDGLIGIFRDDQIIGVIRMPVDDVD